MNNKEKELYKRVNEILWKNWGPIVVNDMALRDEYQSYVHKIISMLSKNRPDKEIADRLFKIEI